MVKFGIRLLGTLGDAAALQKLGVVAEKSGFDGCWFAHDPFQRNSWVSAVAVATATKKITIGYNVKPYTVDPSEVATFAAGLDELSGGRAILGIGSHTESMYEWLGLDETNLVDLTRESVGLIRGLLRGETMKFKGKVFNWNKECYLRFKPLRKDLPIYIPGIGPKMFELSGMVADGSLPMATPPESIDYPLKYIRQGARKAGREVSDVECAGLIWIYVSKEGQVDKMALKRVIAYFLPYLEDEMISRAGVSQKDVRPVTQELANRRYESAARKVTDKMLDLAVYGTPEDCIKRIETMVRKGAATVSIGGPLGKDPVEAIRLIGKEIIPYFRKSS
ncbi:MAG: LLM class flavin-dependent oxidoreductase [Thaumarchaeota archaeon]|nr:LLM class flavin-dependent oxidoreductase [Nitrososphaerota archaeon]MDG6908325.1 LLM class flavin-dependent oxidoreductase [Nitrososphaerota archaeon]